MDALGRIKEAIANGIQSSEDDWVEVFNQYNLSGSSDAETIQNVQKFVSENFSFASPDAEAAYVYFGSDGKVAMWEVVDNICSNSDGRKEYITSTEAGKLFNDDGFNETLRKYSNNNGLLKNTNGIQELYEGTNSSGEISFYNNGKEIKVKAFNDYFSEEYIRNIRCSEVKTIFTGDYLAKNGIGNNAFCRTELNLLLGDNCIETINEIDKNIIKEIMAVAPEEEKLQYVTDVLKMSQMEDIKDIHYVINGTGVDKAVHISPTATEGSTRLIDTIIGTDSSIKNTIDDIIDKLGSKLSDKAVSELKKASKTSQQTITKVLLEDADIFIQNSDLSNFENLVFKYGDNLAKADVSDYVNILKETNLTAKDISFFDYSSNKTQLTIENIEHSVNKSTIYLNEKGEIIGRSYENTFLDGIVKDNIPNEYIHKTTNEIYSEFADDAAMRKKLGAKYDSLSASEKFKLKEIDYFARLTDGLDDTAKVEQAIADYIKGSGKTLGQLDDLDRALINVSSKINVIQEKTPISRVNTWLETMQSSSKFATAMKGLEVAGYGVTVVIAAYTVYDTVSRANAAIDKGNYGEAAGIVAGSSANLAITFIGGETLTASLMPYFAGAGMACAGPVGALIGGMLAGIIGFGAAAGGAKIVDDILKGTGKLWDTLFGSASSMVRYVADPLVLDFDGDGFETLSVNEGVYFDEDSKGLAEKTAWVSPDDALLAMDINGNGMIDDGSELFGTSTKLTDGSTAGSGFQALSQYDSNGDGIIDESDELYSKLLIWHDKNSDGVSQDSELISLKNAGIKTISLNIDNTAGRNISVVTYEDGTTTKLGEFDFDAQYYNTIEKTDIEVSDEIKELPDVKAIGNVESLHTSMQKDESGILKKYVEQFKLSDSRIEKEAIVTNILYFITGAKDVASNSRGSQIDAKILTVVEKFMGKGFVGTEGSNPVNTAAPILNNIYNHIYNTYYCLLNSQTQLSDYINLLYVTESKDGINTINTDTFNQFVKICNDNGADMSEIVGEMGRYIRYVNAANPADFEVYLRNYLIYDNYLETIFDCCIKDGYLGTDDSDSMTGIALDNIMVGLKGNDTISGDAGDDFIVGGTGNDTLEGGTGKDTYVINLGDGQDLIDNYDHAGWKDDRIMLGEGIRAEDIKLYRNGDDLILKNKTNNDKITISQAYAGNSGDYCVGKIEFANIALYEIDYTNVSVELIESYEPVSETGTVVDSMVNLVVQEMSETTASNIIDISRMAEDTSTSDTIQLWEAK